MLVFFPGEAADQNSDNYMAEKDIKALEDAGKAVFIRVSYTTDREKEPVASPVPTCKLTSKNPSRDYAIRSYPAFIVADKFGNEYYRIEGKKPTAKDLEGYFGQISKKADEANKKLQKDLDAANKSWGSKDRNAALKLVMKTFKAGYVGLEAVEATTKLYNELMEDARAEIAKLAEAKDAKALRALKANLKGTDAEKDCDEALKGITS